MIQAPVPFDSETFHTRFGFELLLTAKNGTIHFRDPNLYTMQSERYGGPLYKSYVQYSISKSGNVYRHGGPFYTKSQISRCSSFDEFLHFLQTKGISYREKVVENHGWEVRDCYGSTYHQLG